MPNALMRGTLSVTPVSAIQWMREIMRVMRKHEACGVRARLHLTLLISARASWGLWVEAWSAGGSIAESVSRTHTASCTRGDWLCLQSCKTGSQKQPEVASQRPNKALQTFPREWVDGSQRSPTKVTKQR